MTYSRSRRLSEEELAKVPRHCENWFEVPDDDGLGCRFGDYYEAYPLGDTLLVSVEHGWECAAFKIVIAAENDLILRAERIRDEAIEVFKEHRKYDNRNPVNLGISLRIRKDTFGPRLNWVRFVGKTSNGNYGKKRYFTEPIKLAGKYKTSSRIFKPFPESIRNELINLEGRSARIRYQTEKLSRLRQLCFEADQPAL
jgi:hypothetical protein